MTIRIVTDSTCDLPADLLEENRISVIPAYINIGDRSYIDGVDIIRKEFYEQLPLFTSSPKTSAPGPGAFSSVYRKLTEEGATGVISIHVASTLSNFYNVAQLAAQAADGIRVTVIDSGNLSLSTGLLAVAAAKAAEARRSMGEIIQLVTGMAKRTYAMAVLDTLEFLKRSGRVSALQTDLGTFLKLKPVLKVNNSIIKMEKIRTTRKAIGYLLEQLQALSPLEELALVHTNAAGPVAEFAQMVKDFIPAGKTPLIADVTPVIGTHIGPGAVGFVCITQA